MVLLKMLSSVFSVFDRGSYYANYEKAFAKLEKEEATISNRTQSRAARRRTLTTQILYFGCVLTLAAALYAAWVVQQDSDSYTHQGRFLRVSAFLLIPFTLFLCHHAVLFCFEIMEKYDERILKKLYKSRDDMLRDIKDRNRFNKIQELLQKYDPEEQQKAALLEKLKTAPSQSQRPRGHTPKKPSIGSSLFLGAGKIIDSIANGIIGDQPELLAEVEQLRSMMVELEQKNEALRNENQKLKQDVEQSPQVQEDTAETSAHQKQSSVEI